MTDFQQMLDLVLWSTKLQRYVWKSEWTKEDLEMPEHGTPRRGPGHHDAWPKNPNPATSGLKL